MAEPLSPLSSRRTGFSRAGTGHTDRMTDLPLHILTDAGFTKEEADTIVESLVQGVDLHGEPTPESPIDIDNLPLSKKEALERFNMAVAADA